MENKFLNKAMEILEEKGKDEAINYLKEQRDKINKNEWTDLTIAMSELTSKLYPNLGKGAHVAKFNELFNDSMFVKPVTKFDNMTLDEIIKDSQEKGIPNPEAMRERLENILNNPATMPER